MPGEKLSPPVSLQRRAAAFPKPRGTPEAAAHARGTRWRPQAGTRSRERTGPVGRCFLLGSQGGEPCGAAGGVWETAAPWPVCLSLVSRE